ncbi:DUF5133 domain-containing protein [Streptomyces tritici]|uniref:DUF5133 domain-containing protein n=1 Tax=Streptomyces tritici TaxID=2054410 RepID=UPI003AEF936B
MLLPDRNTIDRLLHHYRAQERTVLARPGDLGIRRRFEDTAYTLCVLMGERTAREAVHAAEHYVGRRAAAAAPAGPAEAVGRAAARTAAPSAG